MIDAAFWRRRRVLITGHTGFKGGWLALWLARLDTEIAGYSLDPYEGPSFFEAANIGAALSDHRGDIRDVERVRRLVKEFDPHVVFHLAAQPLVRQGYLEPVETYSTNVVGTAAVLDACRGAPSLRAAICITSDKCYENREWAWGYREVDRLGGADPYSSSKACAELVVDAFRRSYFTGAAPRVGLATARGGNVLGGGDWAQDRLVPDLARAVVAGKSARIRNPKAIRPWQHVLEPLAGYILLAERLAKDPDTYSVGWNFGPDAASFQSVEDVVAKMAEYWNGKLRWSVDTSEHPHEATRLLLDSSKAVALLGWRSILRIEDAIRLTAEWYDAWHCGGSDMRRVSDAQIDHYTRIAASC